MNGFMMHTGDVLVKTSSVVSAASRRLFEMHDAAMDDAHYQYSSVDIFEIASALEMVDMRLSDHADLLHRADNPKLKLAA